MRQYIDIIRTILNEDENNVIRPDQFRNAPGPAPTGGAPTGGTPSSPLDMTIFQLRNFIKAKPNNSKLVGKLVVEMLSQAMNINPKSAKLIHHAAYTSSYSGKMMEPEISMQGNFLQNINIVPGYVMGWSMSLSLRGIEPTDEDEHDYALGFASSSLWVSLIPLNGRGWDKNILHGMGNWDILDPEDRHGLEMRNWEKEEKENAPFRALQAMTGRSSPIFNPPKPTKKNMVTLRQILAEIIQNAKNSPMGYTLDHGARHTNSGVDESLLAYLEKNEGQIKRVIWR
jgi:hypothetical protein